MENIFLYQAELPPGVNEVVTPCVDGYTVYIDSRLTYESRISAFTHALNHIENNDFDKTNANEIEADAHV